MLIVRCNYVEYIEKMLKFLRTPTFGGKILDSGYWFKTRIIDYKLSVILVFFSQGLALTGCSSITNDVAHNGTPEIDLVQKQLPGDQSGLKKAITEYPVDESRSFEGDVLLEILAAEIAGHRGFYATALKNYEQVALSTKDIGVLVRAISLAEYLKEDQIVLRLSRIWVQEDPKNIKAHIKMAEVGLRLGLFETSFLHMKSVKALGGTPNFEIFPIAMANVAISERKRILVFFEELASSYPNDANLLLASTTLQYQVGDFQKALDSVSKLLLMDRSSRSICLKAQILNGQKKHIESKNLLVKHLKENTKDLRARLLLAQFMFEQRDFISAKSQYRLVLEYRPNDGAVLLALALISLEQKDDVEARRIFERMIRWNTRLDEAYYYLGEISERNQELSEALEHYKRVTSGYGFMNAQFRIASLLKSLEGLESARNHFISLRNRFPSSTKPFSVLESQFLSGLELYEEAIYVLDQELSTTPDDVEILYRKAMIAGQKGSLEILEDSLLRILEIDPDNADALNSLGYTLADKTNRYDEAFDFIEKALSIRPDDPAFIDSMGWVQYRLNNLDAAISYLRKALALFQNDEVAAHLGEVLWVSGQKTEALRIWEEALGVDPFSSILIEVLKRYRGK